MVEQVHGSRRGLSVQKHLSTTRPKDFGLRGTAVSLLGILACVESWGQTQQAPPKDLTTTSIEDLMNVEVTSVSKKEQKLSKTAAAIFVITQEDIRRSGATNIPDLLRMVPGLDVAQINGEHVGDWFSGIQSAVC